jgi:integrase
VPPRGKELTTLAVCLYVRHGELEALDWADVNVEQRYIHVHQAVDRETREVQPTSTDRNWRVPIEPTLMPLPEAMHAAVKGKGRVLPSMPPDEDLARRLRKYLSAEWAGVKRAEHFADDETRRPLSWHDLRHTGITWRAVRGDEPLKISRAAGHDDLRTTQIYINEAQIFDAERFGEVFPPLSYLTSPSGPGAGGVSPSSASFASPARQKERFCRCFWASPAGFEPA